MGLNTTTAAAASAKKGEEQKGKKPNLWVIASAIRTKARPCVGVLVVVIYPRLFVQQAGPPEQKKKRKKLGRYDAPVYITDGLCSRQKEMLLT